MRHPHPEDAFTADDMDRVNDCQEQVIEALAIGYIDPMTRYLQMTHSDIHKLEAIVSAQAEELLLGKILLRDLQV